MTDDYSNLPSEDKNEPFDWFDTIKDIFETPSIPREWLDYFQKIYAYLEIGDPSLTSSAGKKPVSLSKIEQSGWILHDYGSYISVSSGDYAHGLRNSEISEANINSGHGTLVAQSWNSAQRIVTLASQRWPEEAILIGGTPFMQFAAGYWAWLANYEISGLSIHKSDQLAYEQIKTLLGHTSEITPEQRPK